jgi:hypothetical protein
MRAYLPPLDGRWWISKDLQLNVGVLILISCTEVSQLPSVIFNVKRTWL